jgi:hypothetical protein
VTDLKVNTEIGMGINKEIYIKTFMMHNDTKIILSSTPLFKLVEDYIRSGMPYEIVSNDIRILSDIFINYFKELSEKKEELKRNERVKKNAPITFR